MSITAYSVLPLGDVVRVTVTSDLAGEVTYHWYLDGVAVARTVSALGWSSWTLHLAEQSRLEVVDTTDATAEASDLAPDAYPARRTIVWQRSLDTDVDHYRVEQQADGGDWETIGEVWHDDQRWSYSVVSGRLDDLTTYAWRVVPVDRAGNDGTAVAIGSELIVRRPDAPDFTVTFTPATTRVTIDEA